MSLKSFTIILILTCCSGLVSAQYKYTQKLGSFATVNLPDTPKIKKAEGTQLYIIQKGPIYIAQVGDVKGGLRDLFKKNILDSIYDGYVNGTLNSNKEAKLFYKDKIKINGHNGIEFGYTALFNGQKTYRYQHALCLNDTLLMCGIWASDSLSKDDPNLKPFFDGFKVKTFEQLNKASATETARKIGKALALLVFIAIPVLLGLGIVFIIRKLVYKGNKKNQSPVE